MRWSLSPLPSASRNLLIICKRDPENSPEYLAFLYLCGNHWRCGASVVVVGGVPWLCVSLVSQCSHVCVLKIVDPVCVCAACRVAVGAEGCCVLLSFRRSCRSSVLHVVAGWFSPCLCASCAVGLACGPASPACNSQAFFYMHALDPDDALLMTSMVVLKTPHTWFRA